MKAKTYIIRDGAMASRVQEIIGELPLDKPWKVTIEQHSDKRSLDQNALYWKWVQVIHDTTGQGKMDVHAELMASFLEPVAWADYQGQRVPIFTTTKLSVADFSAYLEKILAWAASFGILLPIPEEMHERK